jgi:hypothetical protein
MARPALRIVVSTKDQRELQGLLSSGTVALPIVFYGLLQYRYRGYKLLVAHTMHP